MDLYLPLAMTSAAPQITDRTALARQRRRALDSGHPALFLHEEAARLLQERLSEVNRGFTKLALISPFPESYRGIGREAAVVSDADVLDLTEGAHDLVLHALALHWANDPVGQLIQARRALEPDGLFMGVTLGGRTLAELRAALAEAESRVTGGLSPRVLPMGEIRDLGALLQRAGFALPVADSLTVSASYETAFHLMRDLRAMGEGNALTARLRRFTSRAVFSEAARIYADTYGTPDGRITATFEMVFLTGWAPSSNQPQPLRPGSATTRLADALGVREQPTGDRVRRPGN